MLNPFSLEYNFMLTRHNTNYFKRGVITADIKRVKKTLLNQSF